MFITFFLNESGAKSQRYSIILLFWLFIAEIESTFKKIREGIDEFDSIWDRVFVDLLYILI